MHFRPPEQTYCIYLILGSSFVCWILSYPIGFTEKHSLPMGRNHVVTESLQFQRAAHTQLDRGPYPRKYIPSCFNTTWADISVCSLTCSIQSIDVEMTIKCIHLYHDDDESDESDEMVARPRVASSSSMMGTPLTLSDPRIKTTSNLRGWKKL